MNQRTKKLMVMYEALHPKDDIDRLYMSKKTEEECYIIKRMINYIYNVSLIMFY